MNEEIDENLKDLFRLIKVLREKGIMDLIISIAENYEDLFEIIAHWLSKPSNLNAAKNLALIYGFSKRVDSEKFREVIFALAKGIEKGYEEAKKEEKIGLVGLLRLLNDKDFNRGLRAFLGVLKGMGEYLK